MFSQVRLCAQGLGKQQSDRWHRRLELNGPGDAERVTARINKYTPATRDQLHSLPSFWPLLQKHLRHPATRITITSKESFGVLQSDSSMQPDGNLQKIRSEALEGKRKSLKTNLSNNKRAASNPAELIKLQNGWFKSKEETHANDVPGNLCEM